MSQTKAQLIQPIGVVTAGGVVVTGVVTASSFDGDVVGTATSIISGGNLNVGIISATNFSGDFTGTATGIKTAADIKVGSFTATNFTGDFTGTATSMMRGTGFEAGAVNATGFVANVTGNVTGNATGLAASVTSGANIHIGVITATSYVGDGSNMTGIAATNFNTQVVPGSTYSINVTNDGSSNYTLSGTDRNGTVSGNDPTVTVEIGDTLNFVVDASGHPFYIRVSDGGANVSTPAATNQGSQSGTVSWTPNTAGTYYYQCGNHAGMIGTITVTATTTIDLSAGNCITFNQLSNRTVAFANTSTSMDVTIIRGTSSSGTITWPDSVKWDGGTAPTLISGTQLSGESQQFQLLTRDSGVTWYAWENMESSISLKYNLFTFGCDEEGMLGQDTESAHRSSPVQVPGVWAHVNVQRDQKRNVMATKPDNTLWFWGNGNVGLSGLNSQTDRSSPTQIPGTNWSLQGLGGSGESNLISKTDGTLWAWGNNENGELGQNAPNNAARSSPVQIPGTTWATSLYSILRSSEASNAAIKTDGTLWAWSRNLHGRLGLNDTTQRSSPTQVPGTTWSKVGGGDKNCFGIKTDGTLWGWGLNEHGGLGVNDTANRSSPTQVGTDTTWDNINSGGYGQTSAVKTDGTLWSWGYGQYGSFGNNQPGAFRRSSPTQIPGTWNQAVVSLWAFSLATKANGELWAWGRNNSQGGGNLGQNDRTTTSSPKQVPGTTWRYAWNAFAASFVLKDAED